MGKHILEDTLERTARIISQRAGVTVEFRGNQTPSTNGKIIHLPALPTPLTEEVEIAFKAYLDHEVAHCLFSSFLLNEKFTKKYGIQGFMILNALEDIRIESKMGQEYPGSKYNFERAYLVESPKWQEIIPKCMFGTRLIGSIIAVGKGWDTAIYGDDVQEFIKPVAHLIRKVIDLADTFAVARIAVRIIRAFKRIKDYKPHVPYQRPNQGEHGKGERELDGVEGQGAIEISADNPFSHGKFLQDAINHAMECQVSVPYRVYSTNEDMIVHAEDGDVRHYIQILEDARPLVSGLRQKLILTLRGKQQRRLIPSENGTILNRKRLHTICLDVPGSPLASKMESQSTEVIVSLQIDQSGSMRGERMRLAKSCAVLLAETMDQLHLPLEIIGFTTTHDHSYIAELRRRDRQSADEIEKQFARFIPLLHVIYKEYREPLRKCRGRFENMIARHYTPLNESILIAARRLMEVKASRRIQIVLTDGMSFLGSKVTQHVAQQNLRDNLDLLKRAGIEVIAVGVKAPYVLDVFPTAVNVAELRELPNEFYKVISRSILSKKR